jgi:hypothetical protein
MRGIYQLISIFMRDQDLPYTKAYSIQDAHQALERALIKYKVRERTSKYDGGDDVAIAVFHKGGPRRTEGLSDLSQERKIPYQGGNQSRNETRPNR